MEVKAKLLGKKEEVPTAKKDKHGNLITSPELLKKLYVETYKQ